MSPTPAIISIFKRRCLAMVECFILKLTLEDFPLTECRGLEKKKTVSNQTLANDYSPVFSSFSFIDTRLTWKKAKW